MKRWFETDSVTTEHIKQRKRDYYTVFYGTENNRAVFSHICFTIENMIADTEKKAIEKNALRDLMLQIKNNCGLEVYKDVIDAEAVSITNRTGD